MYMYMYYCYYNNLIDSQLYFPCLAACRSSVCWMCSLLASLLMISKMCKWQGTYLYMYVHEV